MTNLASWKLNWLEAIADSERRLTPLAVLIAIMFATKYMQKTGTGYMGAESLAKKLGRDRRNIRDALAELKKEGWPIQTVTSTGGWGRAHIYKLPDQYQENTGNSNPVSATTGVIAFHNSGTSTPPSRLSSRVEQRTSYAARGAAAREDSFVGPKHKQDGPTERSSPRQKRKQRTEFPADWVLGPTEESVAAKLANWDAARAEEEFEKCRNWYNERPDLRFVNWTPRWSTWCRQGAKIDAREKSDQANRGSYPRGNGKSDPTSHRRAAADWLAMHEAQDAQDAWEAEND